MVRLSSIPIRASSSRDDGKAKEGTDGFTTSVYGSKFATQTLPKDEMPEGEMPRDIAYRMIKDDLSLDGNPRLKYVVSSGI